MFFGAYLGPEDQVAPWRAAVEQHADWLGLRYTPSVWQQPDGRAFTCAWLTTPDFDGRPHMRTVDDTVEIGTGCDLPGGAPWQAESDPTATNEARLRLAQHRGDLSVFVQPLSPEHLFYSTTTNSIAISNDLRLLIRLTGLELDERAVYSLLQYGAIVPPFSISRQIQRIPNGHILRVRSQPDRLTTALEMRALPRGTPLPASVTPELALRQTMDGLLGQTPRNSAVFFSGGVDSGLIAARLSSLGRKDVTLINFSFGPHDEESDLARRMAAHLGMRCEQITYDQSRFMDVLWRAAEDYSLPFSDFSVLPMNMMIRAAFPGKLHPPCLIEGVGADNTFGEGLKLGQWQRLYRLPLRARAVGGWVYKARSGWEGDTRGTRMGRAVRRSAQMPLLLAAHARNALDGIAYHMPGEIREQVDGAFTKYRFELARQLSPQDQYSFMLTMHESCGYVAQKSYDPLRARGITPQSPYLEPALTQLALALTWEQKSAGGVSKALLKGMLARQVPPEMVYRRKSGFVPPYEAMLASQPMQSYLREIVLSPSSPLAPYYDRAVVERIVNQTQEWKQLNLEVYYFFLWTLIFLTAWLYPFHHRS